MPDDDPVVVPRYDRESHAEFRSMVTAVLDGDGVLSRQLVGRSDRPRAALHAGAVEMAAMVEWVAARTGRDPEGLWQEMCQWFERDTDPRG